MVGLLDGGLGWWVVCCEEEVADGVSERSGGLRVEVVRGDGRASVVEGSVVRGVGFGGGFRGEEELASGRISGPMVEEIGGAGRAAVGAGSRCFTGAREENGTAAVVDACARGALHVRAPGFAFGFAYGRTRRSSGGPREARGATSSETTPHRPLARSVLQPRSIVECFGAGSVGCGGSGCGR